MDPVGRQGRIKGNSKGYLKEKLGENNSWESNAPSDLGGGFNTRSGTRKAAGTLNGDEWQGTVKGKTKHTYGVDGKNDPDGTRTKDAKANNNIKKVTWEAEHHG